MIRLAIQAIMLALCLSGVVGIAIHMWPLIEGPLALAPPVAVEPERPERYQPPAQLVRAPLADFATIVTRPLFFEDRRIPQRARVVPPVSPSPAPKPLVPPPAFKVMGIVQDGAIRRALIEAPSVVLDWYNEGANLKGWTISRIDNNSVVLNSNDQRVEIHLFRGPHAN